MSQITNVVTLKQYANKHGLDGKRLRRLARKNEWPNDNGPFKFGGDDGIWAIDTDAPAIVLPDKSTRGTRRADGRQRFVVYANKTELATVVGIVGNDNVVNPRVAAKSRRDARKLADAVADAVVDAVETGNDMADDIARATVLNDAELAAIERGIDTLETDVNE